MASMANSGKSCQDYERLVSLRPSQSAMRKVLKKIVIPWDSSVSVSTPVLQDLIRSVLKLPSFTRSFAKVTQSPAANLSTETEAAALTTTTAAISTKATTHAPTRIDLKFIIGVDDTDFQTVLKISL
jgi:hypothetical protein